MKKTWFFCILAVLALVCASVCFAEGTETEVYDELADLDWLFGGPHLVRSTIPEDLREEDIFTSPWETHISFFHEHTRNRASTYADKVEITYLSGDESLLDYISFDGEQLKADISAIPQAGEVSFHLHAQGPDRSDSGKLHVHDRDYTLKMVPYEGPVMEFLDDVNELTLRPASFDFDDFFAMIARYTEAGSGMPVRRIYSNSSSDGSSFTTGFMEEGDHTENIRVDFGDIKYSKEIVLHINPYEIMGSALAYIGQPQSYDVQIYDMWGRTDPAEGFVFSGGGNGVSVSPDGRVEVSSDAQVGDTAVLTAARERDGLTLHREITVSPLPWEAMEYRMPALGSFSVPVPADEAFSLETGLDDAGDPFIKADAGNASFRYSLVSLKDQRHARDVLLIKKELAQTLEKRLETAGEGFEFSVSGFPAICWLRYKYQYDTDEELALTDIGYRNSRMTGWTCSVIIRQPDARLNFSFGWKKQDDRDALPIPDLESCLSVVRRMKYQGAPVELREKDPVPEIIQAEQVSKITEGESLRFTVSDESRALEATWGEVEWSLVSSSGKEIKGWSIDSTGLLSTGKGALRTGAAQVNVCARYAGAADSAVCTVTVMPELQKLWIGYSCSNQVTFPGCETHLSVSAQPFGADIGQCEWSVSKPELIEYTVEEDGLRFTPLAPGKVTFTVKNEDKKQATLAITIGTKPVTEVAVSVKKGTPKPGATVSLACALTPKKPDNPLVLWSMDADESVATLDEYKGVLKISKDAPAGTEITVTCTAYGAPEPVSESLTLTVE